MNNYNELIAKCDYWINLGDEIDKKLAITKFMEECRDAIEQLVSDYEILAKMYAKVNEDLCVRTKDRDDLERILSDVIKERDKAIEDISEYKPCTFCKHYGESMCDYPNDDCFEWRGVRSEENVR